MPSGQIVHVGFEILDDTRLVCRCEEGTVVRELKSAYGSIVGLKNCLKVEGETVPESELATRRSCEYAPAFWCPLMFNRTIPLC